MIYKFTIPHKLPSLNDYVRACRAHKMAGASMKKKTEKLISEFMTDLVPITGPVSIHCHWTDANGRRDIDNVSFAVKFILDALQHQGILPNDNREYVRDISHSFEVDKESKEYSVTVTLTEM